jgi:hypothetical protein
VDNSWQLRLATTAAPQPLLRQGSAGRRTHLRGSWAVAVTEAVRAMGFPSSSSSVMVRASSGGASAHPRPRADSSWSPQAPPTLQLRWTMTEIGGWQRRLGQMWQLSLGPNYAQYRALFIGFLDRIVDGKNLNTFLVWIEFYLVKIWKKSRRGQIRVGYDNGNKIPRRANMG